MAFTINIPPKVLMAGLSQARDKLNGHRFPIADKIQHYPLCRSPEGLYGSLTLFTALQDISYDDLNKQQSSNYLASFLSHNLAASASLERLLSVSLSNEKPPPCNYFFRHHTNYAQKHPFPINANLAALTCSFDDVRPRPHLESLVCSFYEWVITQTAENLVSSGSAGNLSDNRLSFEGSTYSAKLPSPKYNGTPTGPIDISRYLPNRNHSTPTNTTPKSIPKSSSRTSFSSSQQPMQAPNNSPINIHSRISYAPNDPSGNGKKQPVDGKITGPYAHRSPNSIAETYIYGHDEFKEEFCKISLIAHNRDYLTSLFPAEKLFQNYLLLGPPGTGKTTLVRALAEECGLKFYNIPCASIRNEYYSRSAANLQEIFRQASLEIKSRQEPGAIIFFDEFDHIAKHRGYGHSPENDSLVTVLNENLDGSGSCTGLITFAASNVEGLIDPAITSRFRKFYFAYPSTNDGIIGIHEVIIKKMENYANHRFFAELDYSQILPVSKSDERYRSGRIIDNILYNTAVEHVLSHLSSPVRPLQLSRDQLPANQDPSLPLIKTFDVLAQYQKFRLDV